jgi:hypothetical protein
MGGKKNILRKKVKFLCAPKYQINEQIKVNLDIRLSPWNEY